MPLEVRYARTQASDVVGAMQDLSTQLGPDGLDAVIFFCSPGYDLEALGPALGSTFSCPMTGCTAAGQIGPLGFESCGILAAGLYGGSLRLHPFPITPLSDLQAQCALAVQAAHAAAAAAQGKNHFGLLLVDGLSANEEFLAAALYQMLGDIPFVGGSAGDNLKFEATHVYYDGRFLSDAAVFGLFECAVPFATFKLQHFSPSEVQLVITRADPESRLIIEINGEPAAQAYADAVGLPLEALSPVTFSTHPLLLMLGGEPYIRSIRQVNDDLSLTCYCAVDEGRIVSVGRAIDPLETLATAFDEVQQAIPKPAIVIGCDCILRRIEFEQTGRAAEIGALITQHRVFGFSTYGEQFNGLHVNQTFTGVAIGSGR